MITRTLEKQPEMAQMFDYYEGLSPTRLTCEGIFSEVCWIVYSSGFRYSVVRKYWPALRKALYDFDICLAAGEGMEVSKAASRICEVSGFRNMSKAAWCVENARRIDELEGEFDHCGGIRGFFRLMAERNVSELVATAPQTIRELRLKGIGGDNRFPPHEECWTRRVQTRYSCATPLDQDGVGL